MVDRPTLYIFSGLPGSGKTTLAQEISSALKCVYLRVDTIEQGLRDLCNVNVEGEGYRLAYRVASDNLKCGMSVVADSCNPIALTRREWEDVARSSNADFVNIEVVCSDVEEHKRRVAQRKSTIPGMMLPTWEKIRAREYHPWESDRLVLDTSAKSSEESVQELISAIIEWR